MQDERKQGKAFKPFIPWRDHVKSVDERKVTNVTGIIEGILRR